MKTKKCGGKYGCGKVKPITEFHKAGFRYGKQEYSVICKLCSTKKITTPEERAKRTALMKKWRSNPNNRKKENERENTPEAKAKKQSRHKKYLKDKKYTNKRRIGNLVRKSFRLAGTRKSKKTETMLGVDILEGVIWLERDGRKIEDHDIDHIIPMVCAETENEQELLNNIYNLQLLTREENLSKGDKLPEPHELSEHLPAEVRAIYDRARSQ